MLAAISGVGMVIVVLTLLARGDTRQQGAAPPGGCPAIADGAERLACFDNSAHLPASQPARGANAPAFHHF